MQNDASEISDTCAGIQNGSFTVFEPGKLVSNIMMMNRYTGQPIVEKTNKNNYVNPTVVYLSKHGGLFNSPYEHHLFTDD